MDKIDVPYYRDNGFFYFPCVELIPFLKAVYASTKENWNNASFKNHWSELLKMLSYKKFQTSFTVFVYCGE